MRIFLLAGIVFIALGGVALNERQQRQAAEAAAASATKAADQIIASSDVVMATASGKAKSLESKAADAAKSAAELTTKLKSAELDKQHLRSERDKANETATAVAKERDSITAECRKLTDELAAAKKEIADAAKEALKAAHSTCPPPTNDEPDEKAAKELAPRVQRANGEKAWPEDYEWCKAKARELNRPLLTIFVTNACVHCQEVDRDVLPVPRVCTKLFKDFVPCWVMVNSKRSANYQLAESLGINQFQYPAVIMEYPDGKSFVLFRPSKDPDSFLKQVAANLEKLEP